MNMSITEVDIKHAEGVVPTCRENGMLIGNNKFLLCKELSNDDNSE